MQPNNLTQIDKKLIAESFSNAATTYDDAAIIQKEVGRRLEERLDFIKLKPTTVLDVGASTGRFSQKLNSRYPDAKLYSVDIALGMLTVGRSQYDNQNQAVCADIEFLPFADNSVELIFSNLTIQWLSNSDQFAKECFRVLKPGGLLFFTTLGPDTLFELKQSWLKVDKSIHVNEFLDMHIIGDSLLQAGYSDPVVDSEVITVTYRSVKQLMQDLKATGTHNLNSGRRKTLTAKSKIEQLIAAYDEFKTEDGAYPASHEIIYGHAWKPETDKLKKQKTAPTEFRISVEDIRRR